MSNQHLVLTTAPPVRAAYSHAVVSDGPYVHISGQGPFDLHDQLVEGDFETQALRTLENVKLVLEGAGSGLECVVRVGAYLQDWSNFRTFDRLYRDFMPEPLPARTCVPVALTRFALEIDAVATLRSA